MLYNEEIYLKKGIIRKKEVWHLRKRIKKGRKVFYLSAMQIVPFRFPDLSLQIQSSTYYFHRQSMGYNFELILFRKGDILLQERFKYRTKIVKRFNEILKLMRTGKLKRLLKMLS